MPQTKQTSATKATPQELEDVWGSPMFEGEPIPAGEYSLRVSEPEIQYGRESSKNPGMPYVKYRLTVTEGEHAGRVFFDGLYLAHQNGDGSKNASLQMTNALLHIICGGVPAEVKATSVHDKEALAAAIAEAIDGREFIGVVKQETDDRGEARNRLARKRTR